MSSEPPPRFSSSGIDLAAAQRARAWSTRPVSGTFISRCTALASAWSASVHVGSPTFSMLACIVSATVLFMWAGHAEPSSFIVYSVSVIIVAAFAMLLPMSQSFLISS